MTVKTHHVKPEDMEQHHLALVVWYDRHRPEVRPGLRELLADWISGGHLSSRPLQLRMLPVKKQSFLRCWLSSCSLLDGFELVVSCLRCWHCKPH
ncbi:hypothetical protein EON65_55085 [archaeon]|nr:MAG: hypothetical protein EON65_55085 [archaeon]